jgi:GWxTD domain-containing protein
MTRSGSSRSRLLLAVFAAAVIAATAPAGAQVEVEGTSREREANDQSLFLDAISFSSRTGGGARLDVFVQVGFDILSFLKNGDLYDASYEMTISVLDSAGSLVSEKLWTEEVKGVSFDRSVSPSSVSITQRSFPVNPGRYLVRVIMYDKESKVNRQIAREVVVPEYAGPDLTLSGIMVLNRVVMQGDRRSITPNVSSNIGTIPDSFFVYVETYNPKNMDTADLFMIVLNGKGDAVLARDTLVVLKPGRGDLILTFHHATLALGDYRLVVSARSPKAKEDDPMLATTMKNVIVRWQGVPRSVKDLDLAIDQLRYIAKDDEFSSLRDAKTPEEKQTKFNAFWKKRDPNPNTPRNERMEEFYARVEYANKHFSHYLDGWRTDMGMVFIIFGPPNNVERHPFETDTKPYEVWSYYELNYSILFMDETGFGDYKLQTPIWELWQRIRN